MRTLVVTGAGGYLGRHLVAAARASGWRVIAATRRPIVADVEWLPYRLEDEIAADAIPDRAVIVHLAAQTGAALDASIEQRAADRLIDAATRRHARLVFVSSQTARADAPTPYGRTKAAIEARVVAAGGIAVRPGLVYGGSPGGVYADLLRLVKAYRFLPALVPSPKVQPVHVEDLARALLHAGLHGAPRSVMRVGAEPVALDDFLRAVARGRGRTPPRFVPVPALLVPFGARILDLAGARTLATRMRSLVDLPPLAADDAATIGVALRSLAEGIARRHPERRAVAAEGAVMLRYALGERPPVWGVRRYVRYVEAQRDVRVLTLPTIVRVWPGALRALDERRWLARHPELDWRLGAAIAIAEASPEGARRFLRTERRDRVPIVLLRLAGVAVVEGIARLAGWPLRAFVRCEPDG